MIMLTRVIKSHASQDIISYFWYQYFSWRYIYKPMSPIMLRCINNIYVLIYRDGKINRIGPFSNKLCARLHCIITIMYKLVKFKLNVWHKLFLLVCLNAMDTIWMYHLQFGEQHLARWKNFTISTVLSRGNEKWMFFRNIVICRIIIWLQGYDCFVVETFML